MEEIQKEINQHKEAIKIIENTQIKYHNDMILSLLIRYQNECLHPKVISYISRKMDYMTNNRCLICSKKFLSLDELRNSKISLQIFVKI